MRLTGQLGSRRQKDRASDASPPISIDWYRPTKSPIGQIVNEVTAPYGRLQVHLWDAGWQIRA